jgi:hypothetical protein
MDFRILFGAYGKKKPAFHLGKWAHFLAPSGPEKPSLKGVGMEVSPEEFVFRSCVVFLSIDQEKKGNGMSLQEALREFKAGVVAKLPAEDVALMDEATEELIRSGIAAKAKRVGEMAPDFTLPNTSGELVKLSDLLAQGPVVVTFYRGTW